MIEVLLGSKSAEKVLQYLLARESAYTREIADFYELSPSVIKKQLDKFELGGIIVGKKFANMRIYELNKRNIFYKELSALLIKARSCYTSEERAKLVKKQRDRPRSNKKPLIMKENINE